MNQFQREQVVAKFLDLTAKEFYDKLMAMTSEEIDTWADHPIGESVSAMAGIVLGTEGPDDDKLYLRGIAATCDDELLRTVQVFGSDPEWTPSS